MNNLKRGINNQALGLLPWLLFIFLNDHLPCTLSFIASISICIVCLFLYQALKKKTIYHHLLLPVAVSIFLYTLILGFHSSFLSYLYLPLIMEILLMISLTFVLLSKRIIFKRFRSSQQPADKRILLRVSLDEFFFVNRLLLGVYTFHIFILFAYRLIPEEARMYALEQFLFQKLGLVLGFLLILYEQIRVSWIKKNLRLEIWLPVLDEKKKVIGRIAHSVSGTLSKKYYHPIVRIAVIYRGMLYLIHRSKETFLLPDTIDYPFCGYILYQYGVKDTVQDLLEDFSEYKELNPQFQINYTFENEKVKHLVYLYTLRIKTEKVMEAISRLGGKLWTIKQIEENLKSGIFSEHFEQEFDYLQNTILLADSFYNTKELQP